MAKQNFYEELDLRYGEIAIAMKQIDRMKPGKIPFYIPVLTPNMSGEKEVSNKIIQRDKSTLSNIDKGTIDVSNVELCNTIEIEVPRELCALPGALYDVNGILNIRGSYSMSGNGKTEISGSLSGSENSSGSRDDKSISLSGGGSISIDGSSLLGINVNGSGSALETFSGNTKIDGKLIGSTISEGSGTIAITEGATEGYLELVLNKRDRYIPAKSKWLIMFIGGDINMPRIISRLPD